MFLFNTKTEGIGTVRSSDAIRSFDDDELSSDDAEEQADGEGDLEAEANWDDDEDESERETRQAPASPRAESPGPVKTPTELSSPGSPTPVASPVTVTPNVSIVAPSPVAVAPAASLPAPTSSLSSITGMAGTSPAPSPKPKFVGKLPKLPFKRPTLPNIVSFDSSASNSTLNMPGGYPITESSRPTTPGVPMTPGSAAKRAKFPKWKKKGGDYNFNAAEDILGIVMLEIKGATDLPKLKNSEFL